MAKPKSKRTPKSPAPVEAKPMESVPLPELGVDELFKRVKARFSKRRISATIEPCHCGDEEHRQVEVYELDLPDRLTAKFTDVVFHLNSTDSDWLAGRINRMKKNKASTSKTTTKGDTDMISKKRAKAAAKKVVKGLSNKAIVYKAFKSGTTDRDKLLKLVKGAVKETTIRSWIASWKRKQNLPAIANAKA